MEGGAQADQRAAALPTAVPLCRHHDQAVSVGPGTVRIHTIRMHLDVPMAWQQRVSMRPRSLFLVHSPVVVAGLTALRLLPREHPDHGSCRCGWCPFSNRKRGNGPCLDTSIRRAPDRQAQCNCPAPTPRRVRNGRDLVDLTVREYSTGLKRGQCTLVRMSGRMHAACGAVRARFRSRGHVPFSRLAPFLDRQIRLRFQPT